MYVLALSSFCLWISYFFSVCVLFSFYFLIVLLFCFFFFQAEDGIRDWSVTGVQTCALPIRKPGPVIASRPRLPGWHTPATQGETNRAWLANHCAGLPVVWLGPVMSGRTVKEMPGPGPMASVGVIGLPVCTCCVTPNCQPEMSLGLLDLKGSS